MENDMTLEEYFALTPADLAEQEEKDRKLAELRRKLRKDEGQ